MTDMTTCTNQVDCRPEANRVQQKFSNFINGMILKLKTFHAQRRQRRIDRDAFLNLMSLDDTRLKDIGISRNDIIWASKLAMHKNASKELEKIRMNNIATARTKTTKNTASRKL